MAGYRDTLNLPRTDFPMKAELPKREPDRLAWWTSQRFYERLREQRREAPVWLLHDGPPYSNAHIHMGTAANKIWKDAAVRAASIMGHDAPFVPGWDNHGMPIEIEVAKEFRKKGETPDRLTLRRRCRAYAEHWVGIHREEFVRLGIWGAWDHPYLTMDTHFEAAILEAFADLAARGFVQRGLRSIHWCPTDRTALAEAEIEYQDDPSPSIFVRFPLREDPRGVLAGHANLGAVAWTTTPWTLPANLGLMVSPDARYAVVAADGQAHLVAEARVTALAETAGWKNAQTIATVAGHDLIGLVFEGPWGNASPVVDGTPWVTMDDGTGVVHTAPGHGKEDFAVGQRNGFGVSCPVDEGGRFMAGAEPFVGRSVLEVNDDIIAWLQERGRIVAAGAIRHSYPHCWRCRGPVIFRATHQWFMIIDHDDHRARALDLIENAVRWEPPAARNRIRESVRGRPDWCLSRQRSWGVGIPAIYCEACEEAALDPVVVRRAAELTRDHGSDVWYERPVEDFLPAGWACPACSSAGPFRKESDILDVWFDSGSTHRAVRATHPGLDATWRRALEDGGRIVFFEGPDQHRGWFNSSLMVGVGIDRRAPYTDVWTHGWVLDGEGRAMHKSLGNVLSPLDVVAKLGADVVRWWALATDWRSDVRVGDEILQRVSEAYRKIRNTFRFLLGNLADFTPDRALPADRLLPVDRAFHGALRARLARVRRDWESGLFHRALDLLLDFCTVDLSAVFLDTAKDRLYTLAVDDPARRSAQTVLWRALHDLALAASPALVFTAEEVWQSHPALVAEAESVHLAIWPADTIEPTAADAWTSLREFRDAVNAAIEPLRAAGTLKSTVEAEVVARVSAAMAARLAPYRDELPSFLMVAGVTLTEEPALAASVVTASRTTMARCDRCWTHRPDVGADPGYPALCGRCAGVLAAAAGASPPAER